MDKKLIILKKVFFYQSPKFHTKYDIILEIIPNANRTSITFSFSH